MDTDAASISRWPVGLYVLWRTLSQILEVAKPTKGPRRTRSLKFESLYEYINTSWSCVANISTELGKLECPCSTMSWSPLGNRSIPIGGIESIINTSVGIGTRDR